jgi:small multidrug resistance pump
MSLSLTYFYLGLAIVLEVTATSALKASDGFSRLAPTTLTVIGYVSSFYFLSLSLRTLPTGIAYAIWSGVGIVLISTVSWFWFKQKLDAPALVGMGLIMAGVLVINLFSKSVPH